MNDALLPQEKNTPQRPPEEEVGSSALLPSPAAVTRSSANNNNDATTRTFLEPSFLTTLRAFRESSIDYDSEDDDDDDEDRVAGNERLLSWRNTNDVSSRSLSAVVRRLDVHLRHAKWMWLAVFMCLLWPWGAKSFCVFHAHTDSTFTAVPGSPSAAAQEAFAANYNRGNDDRHQQQDWNDPMHPPLILVLQSTNNSQSLVNETTNVPASTWAEHYARLLEPTLNQYCWTDTGRIPHCTTSRATPWVKVTSYWSLRQQGLPQLAQSLILDENGTTTVLQVQYALPWNFTGDIKARVFGLQDAIDEYTALEQALQRNCSDDTNDPFFTVQTTGIHYFQRDLLDSTRADMRRMDTYALPLALLLFGLVLPQANPWVVWIIPAFGMVTTCCLWAVVMRYLVQPYMQITQFTPTVMMSLSLGMGVDYSLFLLARYLQEMAAAQIKPDDRRRNAQIRQAAMAKMWTKGGHVVLISGVTLLCTFLGLCCLPLPMLQSVGVGAAVAIGAAMVSNLWVVPTLLYTPLGWSIVRQSSTPSTENDARDDLDPSHGAYHEVSALSESIRPETQQHPALRTMQESKTCSVWSWLARQLLHPYKGVIVFVLVCACLVPVGWHATQLESSIAFDLFLPADSPSMETYRQLAQAAGPGRLHPYRILFDGRDVDLRMTTAQGFEIMKRVVHALRQMDENSDLDTKAFGLSADAVAETVDEEVARLAFRFNGFDSVSTNTTTKSTVTHYSGISVLENNPVSHRTYVAAKICGQALISCPIEMFRLIDEVDKTVTSKDQRATYITATLAVNPFTDPGIEWLRSARETIQQLHASGSLSGVHVYIQGLPSIEQDAVDSVYEAFPTMIVLTIIVVFTLTAIFFRSALTPCRSIAGTVLTVCFSFGLAVLVYQGGILNWTHLEPFESLDDGFCWLVPIMTFSIIVGLALDYDAFLMSRILEYRLEGISHKASIAAGLHATGGIITAAGAIMAVAFGSLMFSSSPMLFQWSFIMTTAVLLDTFVIRSVVVPVITSIAGERFWWPRRLPEVQFHFSPTSRTFSEEDVQSRLGQLAESSDYEPLDRPRGTMERD